MAQPDSPQVPPARDRRRAARVRLGPLRVHVHRMHDGLLIDISELGALVRLPAAQIPSKEITLYLEWKDETVQLRARVVRSTPHRVQTGSAVLARTESHVSLEFRDVSQSAATVLKRMMREEEER